MDQTFRWQSHFVRQNRPDSGCIPWGFEILLRIEGASDIDFGEFQNRFDLDKEHNRQPRNNFRSVSDEIMLHYPHISISVMDFPIDHGQEKAERIEALVCQGKPVLVSIPLKPFGYPGWHVMPVIEFSNDDYLMLHSVSSLGRPQVLTITKDDLINAHASYQGGHDIAYVESITLGV